MLNYFLAIDLNSMSVNSLNIWLISALVYLLHDIWSDPVLYTLKGAVSAKTVIINNKETFLIILATGVCWVFVPPEGEATIYSSWS